MTLRRPRAVRLRMLARAVLLDAMCWSGLDPDFRCQAIICSPPFKPHRTYDVHPLCSKLSQTSTQQRPCRKLHPNPHDSLRRSSSADMKISLSRVFDTTPHRDPMQTRGTEDHPGMKDYRKNLLMPQVGAALVESSVLSGTSYYSQTPNTSASSTSTSASLAQSPSDAPRSRDPVRRA